MPSDWADERALAILVGAELPGAWHSQCVAPIAAALRAERSAGVLAVQVAVEAERERGQKLAEAVKNLKRKIDRGEIPDDADNALWEALAAWQEAVK